MQFISTNQSFISPSSSILEVALVFLLLPTHGLADAAHFLCGTYHMQPFIYLEFPDFSSQIWHSESLEGSSYQAQMRNCTW